ncbi:MAG: hypothetical protein V2J10_11005 [Wenzhouxiangella sp.]|jgi:homoserine dehydrogenase|nr:hypothetical protein [Wenzhouxiangella sp.]
MTLETPAAPERAPLASAPRQAVAADVILIGHSGQVGSAVARRLDRIRDRQGRPLLRLRETINRSVHRIRSDEGEIEHRSRAGLLAELVDRPQHAKRPLLIVDCTADSTIPDHYARWLQAGIGVVTPNKHGFSGDRERYDRIQIAARSAGSPLGYAATVGAGLPVLAALRRLRASGASPRRLRAVVSGTLVRVFAGMQAGQTLSDSVAEAQAAGFTEPDPLEDLSGRDVLRKLRIMLREAGYLSAGIDREPVVADAWATGAARSGDVIAALREQDARWARRLSGARRRGLRWIYEARFDGENARVGPVAISESDAFRKLSGSDNRVLLDGIGDDATRWVIEGPGAGVEVTATAVLSDLAEAVERLRTRAV